jgi:hypothetical protein
MDDEGGWKNDKKHGKGTYTFVYGSSCVGEWKNNQKSGQGIWTGNNGDIYVGELKDGKFSGQGTLTYASGTKYVGEWKDGQKNGHGIHTGVDARQYVGEYRDGQKNGQGIYTYADGGIYAGEWKDGKRNGQGTFTHGNGSSLVAEWKDGKPSEQGTETYADGNQEVFITSGNLSSITYLRDSGKFSKSDSIDLYKSYLGSILSEKEMGFLVVYKKLCEDPKSAIGMYKKVKFKPNPSMVYEGRPPSYHANRQCESITSNYFNIQIPAEINGRGAVEIKKFRKFCIDHRDMIENEDTRVFVKLEAQFFLKNPLKTVFALNTGDQSFMDLDQDAIEGLIDDLLMGSEAFRNQDEYTSKLIKAKGYGTHIVKEAKVPDHPLYIWHNEYKQPLKKILKHYFRVKFNEDLKFDGQLLNQLGFRPCGKCFKVSEGLMF